MEINGYDFSGYATRNELRCMDGNIIDKDAFLGNDGATVPLVWNHMHGDPKKVIGHALLKNVDDGVYAYGYLNDSDQASATKALLKNGDIKSLSIWADVLERAGEHIKHGDIKELSVCLAGMNPGAYVDCVIAHSADNGSFEKIDACYDEDIIVHSDDAGKTDETKNEKTKTEDPKDKTLGDLFQSLLDKGTPEEKDAAYAAVAMAAGLTGDEPDNDETEKKGKEEMKHHVFENETEKIANGSVISHAVQEEILNLAKQSGVGNLKDAIKLYGEQNAGKDEIKHSVFSDGDLEKLFPDYELINKGRPETIMRDQTWIDSVLAGVHKSPMSRLRTRYADARIAELKANGYQKKGDYKKNITQIKLFGRTTDPQTIYIKDSMHRDDKLDITDFDAVEYEWWMLRAILNETLALAFLVGDGREEGDPDKIHEEHIRPIWKDDELYTIHQAIDLAGMKTTLNGTNTGANFGDEYVFAEAMIQASLFSREKYKGSGNLTMYMEQHAINKMLLARDLNGRRIYGSEAELRSALNVKALETVEQFSGLVREGSDGKKYKLLALLVNLTDYTVGATKGGEITKFSDFNMDFNLEQYMLETRCCGTLTKPWSAIAIEEEVTE